MALKLIALNFIVVLIGCFICAYYPGSSTNPNDNETSMKAKLEQLEVSLKSQAEEIVSLKSQVEEIASLKSQIAEINDQLEVAAGLAGKSCSARSTIPAKRFGKTFLKETREIIKNLTQRSSFSPEVGGIYYVYFYHNEATAGGEFKYPHPAYVSQVYTTSDDAEEFVAIVYPISTEPDHLEPTTVMKEIKLCRECYMIGQPTLRDSRKFFRTSILRETGGMLAKLDNGIVTMMKGVCD